MKDENWLKIKVTSLKEALFLLKVGEGRRTYGDSKDNKMSSRSHTIFRMALLPRG